MDAMHCTHNVDVTLAACVSVRLGGRNLAAISSIFRHILAGCWN